MFEVSILVETERCEKAAADKTPAAVRRRMSQIRSPA